MAYDIGPKIGIDGEKEFRSQINYVTQSIRTLGTEMKSVTSEFAGNEQGQQALIAKNKVLQKEIDAQKKKLELLNKGLKESSDKYGENDSKTLKWKATVNNATAELNKMENELSNNEKALDEMSRGLRDAETGIKEAKDEASTFGEVFKANFAVEIIGEFKDLVFEVASSIAGIADETREYRTEQAKLVTAYKDAKYSAETAKKTYSDLNKILADSGQATETANHLAKLCKTEDQLAAWTKICTGVYGTFGTSLPVEGLAEAANETAKVGQVTGPLADALNWAAKEGETFGVKLKKNTKANKEWNDAVKSASSAEDYFNLALQNCSSEQERQQLITDTLTGFYKDAAEQYQVTAADIITANEANQKLEESMGKLGEATEPLISTIKTFVAEGLSRIAEIVTENESSIEGFVDNVIEFGTFVVENKDVIIAGVAGIGAGFIAWNVVTMIQGVVGAIKAFKAANEGATVAQLLLNAAQAANPIGLIVTLIATLVVALITLWNTNEDFRNAVINIFNAVKEKVGNAIKSVQKFFVDLGSAAVEVKDNIMNAIGKAVSYITGIPKTMLTIGKNLVEGLWNGINNAKDWIVGKIKGFKDTVLGSIKNFFGIKSPSTVMRDQVGRYLAEGIGVGFENSMPNVAQDMKSKLNDVVVKNGALLAETRTEISAQIDYDRLENMQGKGIYLNGRLVGREMRNMGVVFVG